MPWIPLKTEAAPRQERSWRIGFGREILVHLRRIKSLKLSYTPSGEFCQMLNDEGLSLNDLIIGLRSKEHESKVEGRFFAMMSWNLRLYFVVMEYLIKGTQA
jgi:hypothetical protein